MGRPLYYPCGIGVRKTESALGAIGEIWRDSTVLHHPVREKPDKGSDVKRKKRGVESPEYVKIILGEPKFRVDITTEDDCWWWRGKIRSNGTCALYYEGIGALPSWHIYWKCVKPIPVRKRVHMMCKHHWCCNPKHMVLVDDNRKHRTPGRLSENDVKFIGSYPQYHGVVTHLAEYYGLEVYMIKRIREVARLKKAIPSSKRIVDMKINGIEDVMVDADPDAT